MEFPEEIVRHINGYAKPMTRCDWRTCGQINRHILIEDVITQYNRRRVILRYHPILSDLIYRRIFTQSLYNDFYREYLKK